MIVASLFRTSNKIYMVVGGAVANQRSGVAKQGRQNRDVDEDDRGPPGPLRRTLLLHKDNRLFFVQNFGSTSPARGGFQNLQKNDTMADIHNGTKATTTTARRPSYQLTARRPTQPHTARRPTTTMARRPSYQVTA